MPPPLPAPISASIPIVPAASSHPQSNRLVPTIRSLPRRAYGREPLPVRPSSHAPRQARIIGRVAEVDHVAYTLDIGGAEVRGIGLDQILEYVSALDLERFENECFVEERNLLAVAEREEKARKQAARNRARAERQARVRGPFDFTTDDDEEDDDADVDATDAAAGTVPDGATPVIVTATGRHGRPRPTYTSFYLKTKARQSRNADPRTGRVREEDEADHNTSSTASKLQQPRAAAESDSDSQLQIPRRRRRKRDKITGELLPLSPTPPKSSISGGVAASRDSDGAGASVDEAVDQGKRPRRRRHPITKELMPLGWKYDPSDEVKAVPGVGATFMQPRDRSAASDMSRLSLVREMPEPKRSRLTPALEEDNMITAPESMAWSQTSPAKQAFVARQIPVAVMQIPPPQPEKPQANLLNAGIESATSTSLDPQGKGDPQSFDIMDEDEDEDKGFVDLPQWRKAKPSPGSVKSTAPMVSTPQRKYQMLSQPIEIDSASSESDDDTGLAKFQKTENDSPRLDQVKTSIVNPLAVNSETSSDEEDDPKLDAGSPVPRRSAEEEDNVEDEAYFIEAILAHQLSDPRTHPSGSGDKPVMLYLVKWEGYEEPTWEPLASFEDPEIVREYRRKAGLDGPSHAIGVDKAFRAPTANMIAAEDSDGGHISI